MRFFPIIAAAGLALFAPAAASASVAPAEAPISATASSPLVLAQTSVRISVGDQRRHHARRHHGRKAYWRRSCRTYWRHGERRRVCNRVRYYRYR